MLVTFNCTWHEISLTRAVNREIWPLLMHFNCFSVRPRFESFIVLLIRALRTFEIRNRNRITIWSGINVIECRRQIYEQIFCEARNPKLFQWFIGPSFYLLVLSSQNFFKLIIKWTWRLFIRYTAFGPRIEQKKKKQREQMSKHFLFIFRIYLLSTLPHFPIHRILPSLICFESYNLHKFGFVYCWHICLTRTQMQTWSKRNRTIHNRLNYLPNSLEFWINSYFFLKTKP